MVYGNLGNLSPLELHRHIRALWKKSVGWLDDLKGQERLWYRLHDGSGSPASPAALMKSVESVWTFPSSQWFSRMSEVWSNVSHPLVTECTTHARPWELWRALMKMATGPNSYDLDSDWNVAWCEISIIASPQGACLFLGYLWLPNFQCNMQFHVSCERCKAQSQLLKVTSKWKCRMGSPSCGMRTNAWHPVAQWLWKIAEVRLKEGEQVVVASLRWILKEPKGLRNCFTT